MTYDSSKSHKKGLQKLGGGGVKLTTPKLFRVKHFNATLAEQITKIALLKSSKQRSKNDFLMEYTLAETILKTSVLTSIFKLKT